MISFVSSLPASVVALFVAILLYGLFGSPTPDDPGLVEIVIGALLLFSAGMGSLQRMRLFWREETVFLRLLHLLFLIGLIVPTLTGVLNGNAPMLILRDILAFSFLCLPLFMAGVFDGHVRAREVLPWVLCFAGICFAVRTLMPAFNIWIAGDELLYLSNSPLVLFTALFLTSILWSLLTTMTPRKFFLAVALLAGIGVIMAAMLLDIQRATLAAIFLTLAALWCGTLIKTPRRVIAPTFLLVVIGLAVYPWMAETANAMVRKTAQVGFNMRFQELQAVIEALSANPVGLFLGTGWGGIFASPAVGGLDVNYTHSLLSTMFLKGGLVLFSFAAFVCVAAIYQIFLIFQRDAGRGLSLFWPFIIPVFLYASHKSLDFGLLLLLIGVWSKSGETLHRKP